MLSPEVVRLVGKRADVLQRKRIREFAAVATAIITSAVDRGMLHSSVTQQLMGEAIRDEFELRTRELWAIMLELSVDQATGDSRELLEEIVGIIAEHLDASASDLSREHTRAVRLMGLGSRRIPTLEEYREQAICDVSADVETALLKARAGVPESVSGDGVPTLFVGSSTAGKAQAKTLVAALERPGLRFLPWWDAFTPGRVLLSDLESIRDRVDGALLLFTPESKTVIRRRSKQIPNLNVLFEFGYFYGHFGPSRVGMVRYGEIYLPSDFGGYIYISGSTKFRRARSTKASQRTINDFNRWIDHLWP